MVDEPNEPYTGKQPIMAIEEDRINGTVVKTCAKCGWAQDECVCQDQVLVVPRQGTPLAMCPSNLDYTSKRGKALALKAGSPGDIEMPADGVLRLTVTNYIIVPDSQVDEKTGEMHEFARCCFFTASGKHFRTTAAHGPFRLKALCDLYDDADWQKGIPLVISVRKSKRGTTYHDIQIDIDSL